MLSICYSPLPSPMARRPPLWARSTSLSRLNDCTQTHHNRKDSFGRMISPTQRPLLEHTTLLRDRHPLLQRDSRAQSQQASGRGTTLWTSAVTGIGLFTPQHAKQTVQKALSNTLGAQNLVCPGFL